MFCAHSDGDLMKVTSNGGSQFRWISFILFFAIIPLWIAGWMLYVVGSKIVFRKGLLENSLYDSLQKFRPKNKTN